MNEPKLTYEFDSYRVDVANRLVLRHDAPLPLTPKAVEILVALIAHRGEILSKSDLMKIVWPDTVVEDSNLTQNIYLLRKTLNQGSNGRQYVETLARRGYRFVGDVREITRDVLIPELPAPRFHPKSSLKTYGVFSAAGLLIYEERGMHEQAVAEFIESLRLQNGNPERIAALRQAYDAGGIKGYWLKWLEFREERIKLGGINPLNVAQVYALVGETDKAFEQLQKACDDHSIPVAALRFGPTFENLRSDQRYSAILKRLKLDS